MEMVKLRHPRIDDGQRVIEVPESAVAQHMRGGWERAEDDPPTPQDAAPPAGDKQTEVPADAGASALKDQPKGRRGQQNKEGE